MRRFVWSALPLTLALVLGACAGPSFGTNYLDTSNLTCRQIVERHNAAVEQSVAYARQVSASRGTRTLPQTWYDFQREVPDFTPAQRKRYYSFFADMRGAIQAFERKGCGDAANMYDLHPVR